VFFLMAIVLGACSDDKIGPVSSDIHGRILDAAKRPLGGASVVLEYDTANSLANSKRQPTTMIRWTQAESGWVTIWIVSFCDTDSLRTLVNGEISAGNHTVTWDGLDDSGRILPDGVYQVHLRQGSTEDLTVVARLGLDYASLGAGEVLAPLAVTDGRGEFTLSQECLPFGYQMTLTNEAGESIGSAISDWITVNEQSGAYVTLHIPN
jgi:hypothetical protein